MDHGLCLTTKNNEQEELKEIKRFNSCPNKMRGWLSPKPQPQNNIGYISYKDRDILINAMYIHLLYR